jgi:uncharacterized protein YgiM (DUF1202 family)
VTRFLLAVVVLSIASLACLMSAAQLETPTPVPSPSATPAPTVTPTATPHEAHEEDVQTATVRAALVNVRANPDGEVIGQVEAGQDVTILEIDGDWVHIAEPDGWLWIGCLDGLSEKGCTAR